MTERLKNSINWKVFFILLTASIFGLIAVIPYTLTIQANLLKNIPIPLHILLPLQLINNTAILAALILIGLNLARKVGLNLPILEGWSEGKEVKTYLKSILGISILSGMLAATLIIGIDHIFLIFGGPISNISPPPIWQRLLASFYGGINEEIMMRLFLMTSLVWLFCKLKRTKENKPTTLNIWLAILISSILFGIGHLPLASTLTELTPSLIARTILLNSIGGIIFGWLYWKKGLESAMISHFSADITLNIIFPLIQ